MGLTGDRSGVVLVAPKSTVDMVDDLLECGVEVASKATLRCENDRNVI
jgi:hypothetical protein